MVFVIPKEGHQSDVKVFSMSKVFFVTCLFPLGILAINVI